jgi:hypothetical protein
MSLAALSLALLLAAPEAAPTPTPPSEESPVILFLVDNSASLPPLDPGEKRVSALEKMFAFLEGQTYRLILFGGRREIFVDDVRRYRNDGQWTDFYFAFEKAHELSKSYPEGTAFRLIFVTDGIMDPRPADWRDMDVPPGADLKAHVAEKLVARVEETGIPLYVILVGELPKDGVAEGSAELAPPLILEMIAAANGARASPAAQSLSSFFDDDGVLLKKFVFRVAPYEGLKTIERVVRRIVAPSRGLVELQFLAGLVLPLILMLFLLLGILVRSFPGPGDLEILELAEGSPVHVTADRMHALEGGWATTGLCLVADAKEASATLTYQLPSLDLTANGLTTVGLDPQSLRLLSLDLEGLKRALREYSDQGTKEEKVYALNLEFMAKSFDAAQAERILTTPTANRGYVQPLDFLRAKTCLLSNDGLRKKLTDARVQFLGYGANVAREELVPGTRVRIGRYRFVVKDVDRKGRRDVRIILHYDRVPSLLGLKTWLPAGFQRWFRLRRSSQRVVT